MNTIQERLTALRGYMEKNNLAAFLIPTEDPHMSEYPAAHFQTRAFISGFHGSAGTVVVTGDKAGLWTDSRYFLEAEHALRGSGIRLFRINTPGTPTWWHWLQSEMKSGETVGLDGACVTIAEHDRLRNLFSVLEMTLQPVDDPFNALWTDRPVLPSAPVYVLPREFAGASPEDRIASIRSALEQSGGNTHIISTLADIAWLLNLRGSDVPFNPVFLSYLIIESDGLTLFTDQERLTAEARVQLQKIGAQVEPYAAFHDHIETLRGAVLIDPDQTGIAVEHHLKNAGRIIHRTQPSIEQKAVKGVPEQANLRNAMHRDGVALIRFLIWLETSLRNGSAVTEIDASRKLTEIRSKGENYISDSFRSIVGANAHGAIIHYSVSEESSIELTAPGVFLVDSGAQYRDGTTDITRTVPIGTAPEEARKDYTLVLKGHIALSRLRFPEGWSGRDIDAVARQPLWLNRRNYGHGTGHGVGYVLNVHEGPQRIAPSRGDYPLKPGMIVSNEPGIYREGMYGIRIENLLIVQEDQETDFGTFLQFETVSICPYSRDMIVTDMLTTDERAWIDAYHKRIYSELEGSLTDAEQNWLRHATAPL